MEECRYKNLLNFLSSSIKVAAEWQHEWKMDGFFKLKHQSSSRVATLLHFLANY
jgi:hypothetical protein